MNFENKVACATRFQSTDSNLDKAIVSAFSCMQSISNVKVMFSLNQTLLRIFKVY